MKKFDPSTYVERKEVQNIISQYLTGNGSKSILQIIGVGGIGKTTTILKSLFDTRLHDYCYWVKCNNDSIEKEIRLIEKNHKNFNFDPIIIFDDIIRENIYETNTYVNHFLKKYSFPKLILSSRESFSRIDSEVVIIEPLDFLKAIYLISMKDQSNQDAIALHELSKGNPLAINLLTQNSDSWTIESIQEKIQFKKEVNPTKIIIPNEIKIIDINQDLLYRIEQDPNILFNISPRKFEELVAEILVKFGFNVELTPSIKDGGVDIIASQTTELGKHLCLVEAKKYSPHRPIGVSKIRELYGTFMDYQANSTLMVTTSTFTKGSIEFQQKYKYQIELKDYFNVLKWVNKYNHQP